MREILTSLKNIFKELLLIICLTFVLISFLLPTITLWGGLYYDTVDSEMGAVIIKTSMAWNQYKSDGKFVWNCEEKEVVYDH